MRHHDDPFRPRPARARNGIVSIFCRVEDKNIPLYRVLWIAATPHFCGEDDCTREGDYEVRLEQGESLWAKPKERDQLVVALESWQGGLGGPEGDSEGGDFSS